MNAPQQKSSKARDNSVFVPRSSISTFTKIDCDSTSYPCLKLDLSTGIAV
jgi:hypothetical protein